MTKTELIAKVATSQGYTKKDTGAVVDAVLATIVETVAAGEEVNLTGFGKFTSVDVAEKTGTIMMGERKGETYTTPAHKAPKFKFSSTFKNAVK